MRLGPQPPMAMICHVGPALENAAADTKEVLFISQMAGVPSVFCQTMSAIPSPLKSPAPITCQVDPGLAPASAPETRFVPSINQIAGDASLFCQRMSDLPSPLKSPVALMCQADPGLVRSVPETKFNPSISQ